MGLFFNFANFRATLLASIAFAISGTVSAQAPGNAVVLNNNESSVEFSNLTLNPSDPPVIKGDVWLVYQGDGNLVIYKGIPNEPARVLWDARVSKSECAMLNACQMKFIPGIGIVLYANGAEYWRSNVKTSQRVAKLWISKVAPFIAIKSSGSATPAGVNDPKNFGGNTLWTGMSRLNWLGVLDNLRNTNGEGFYGSSRPGVTDFSTLFSNLGYWQNTAKNTHVFKFYAQPFANYSTLSNTEKSRLEAAINFLRANNIAMGVELAVVERSEANLNICGRGVEGVAGSGYAQAVANNVKEAGGVIDFIAMDEPFFYSYYLANVGSTELSPAQPCNYTTESLATAVASSFKIVQNVFPSVVLGDTEPTYRFVAAALPAYLEFLDKLETKIGAQIGFVHDDVSLLNVAWRDAAFPMWGALGARRIPYGMIWNGNLENPPLPTAVKQNQPDARWVGYGVGKFKQYSDLSALPCIHNVFQSWDAWPATAGPETSPNALTFLANYVYTKSIRSTSYAFAPVSVNRFYHPQLMHSYGLGTYFASGFSLEGEAFRVTPLGYSGTQALRLCKLLAQNRHFVSSVNPPATVCEVPGTAAVNSLGGVSYVMDRNTTEPLYRCRHTATGSYLTTINPQECTFFAGAPNWAIDGVIGYAISPH